MDRRVTQLFSSIAVVAVGIMSAGLVAQPAAANTAPASDCVTVCTAKFDTVGHASFRIPTGITTLTATLAGSAGAPASFAITNDPTAVGGNGGAATVELGASYAGSTFTFGVGATGAGTYLVGSDNTLLAVAGGGGGGGFAAHFQQTEQILATFPGGDGASPTAAGITFGSDGVAFGTHQANGRGGTTTGGVRGNAPSVVNGTAGHAGGSTHTVNGDGTVALPAGGAGGSFFSAAHIGGTGGSGYTAGGGGAVQRFVPNGDDDADLVAPGGGGSAYLDASLTAEAQSPNTRGGSVTFTWGYSPKIGSSVPGTTPGTTPVFKRGTSVPVSISGLPARAEFSVVFDGMVVARGITDASGTATSSFLISQTQSAGTFSFELRVGTATVAVSGPIVVEVAKPVVPVDPDVDTPSVTVPNVDTAVEVADKPAAASRLASTGAAVTGGLVAAVLLLGGGAAFFFISRRRRGPLDKP